MLLGFLQLDPYLDMVGEAGERAPTVGIDLDPPVLLHEAAIGRAGMFLFAGV